jgi:hypothetical protein
MPRQISQERITEAILDGICNAEKAYEKWSGGEILAYTAEHVLYGFLAKSIMKIPGSKYIEIEPRCKVIIEAACGKRRGRLPKAARPEGHIDMLLWWADNTPRAVIEIKNNVYNYSGQCDTDIKRIVKMLSMSNTTLQFGIFAFYSSADGGKRKKAKTKLENRFNSIQSRINDAYGKNFKVSGSQKIVNYTNIDNNISAWSGSCIVMKPYK